MLDSPEIDRLLAFLVAFERGDFAAARSHYLATGHYLPEVMELTRAIYDTGLVRRDFNWVAWTGEARSFFQKLGLVAEADLETIAKLLTISVRQDRFVGGMMPGLCSSGFIPAVLNRLADLRAEEMGEPDA